MDDNKCSECGRIMDDEGTCWYCQYHALNDTKSRTDAARNAKIGRYEQEAKDLEHKIYQLEQDKHTLEDKVKELDRALSRAGRAW